jgi:hypothetical protein
VFSQVADSATSTAPNSRVPETHDFEATRGGVK